MEKKGINKNIYRLWYEYLKRSDDYNRLCELIRGEKTAFDPPKTLEESINFNKNLLSFLKNNPGLYSDKGFRLPLDTFIYNGDLFSMTFNKWYKYKLKWEHYRKNFEYDEEIPVKLVDRNYIDSYLEVLEKKTLKKYRREPTLSEVKDLLELILGPNSSILSFIVDVNFVDNLNFSKNINALTNKFKKILKHKAFEHQKYFAVSSKRIRYDELNKYLQVYDLFQKYQKDEEFKTKDGQVVKDKIFREIIKKIGSNAEKYEINQQKNLDQQKVLRQYRSYYAKAIKIIKNTEYGFFPGKY